VRGVRPDRGQGHGRGHARAPPLQRGARHLLEVTQYSLETYAPEDRGDYVRLLGEAWGHQGLSGEEYDWWFDRNPAGSVRSVARADGQVVGVAAHTLLRMVLGGRERVAAFSVHATTHPSMRGRGIFAALEEKHEREASKRGVDVVLAFAS